MISSHNDWSQLKECFVGIADNMVHPKMDLSVMSFSYAGYDFEEVKDLVENAQKASEAAGSRTTAKIG